MSLDHVRKKSWGRCEVSEVSSLTSQPTLLIATPIKAAATHPNNPTPNQIFITIAVFCSAL
jgi:hypothetical protein